jgi:hypothetical protein
MLSQVLLNFLKSKSPTLARVPTDMVQFSGLQYYKEYVDEYSNFGWLKYLSEEEKNNTVDNGEEFSYYINDMGFRGNYPSVDDKKLIAFFGCSIAFGQGLPEHKIYADLIAKHYDKQYLNLGIPGAGCHRIALAFSAASNVWDLETVVINLPPFTRFHYIDKTNHLHSVLLTHKIELPEIEKIRIDIIKDFSDQFLLSQAIDAIQWMIDIAKSKRINLILASWDDDMIQAVKTALGIDILKFNTIDRARDGHPGIESHKTFANDVINILASETYTC